ncbi:MAG: PH domain-containing protein [Planctomycetota bacterium]
MLYSLCKGLALSVMKAPTRPPDPPAGSHGEVQVHRASPKFLSYRLLGFWIIFSLNWLLLWGILFTGLLTREIAPLIIAIVLMPVLAVMQFCFYFALRIDYDLRYYIVTDRSLRIREGAFIVKEKTISYANVQNLRVVQGPIMRLFRIWHLKVDTAGGGSSSEGQPHRVAHRVQMAGIETAHAVRDRIRGHLRRHATSTGLGDLDDRDDDAPVRAVGDASFLQALRELQGATAGLRGAVGGSRDSV